MPVTWELQDRLLVLRLIENYDYEAPVRAVEEALRDPAFQRGTALLIDARLSTTRRSSEEFRERALWMASLKQRCLADRCAIVINSRAHQFGVARMAATHVEMRGMELGIFTDVETAATWLRDCASGEASAGR